VLPSYHCKEQLSKHSLIDIDLKCDGDLQVDSHHTIEDVGWALGNAINKALGNKKGIKRYSFSYLPMDECLTRCCVDVSGRPWLVWNVFLPTKSIKNIETEIFKEFFQSFSQSAGLTLHVENLYGKNTHHIIESCFKSLAITIRKAISVDIMNKDNIPSTKGTLTGSI
jgi:imidazoleglycerol-phosphate dehydratase